MKYLLLLFTMLIMAACGRQHVYHIYYGDIDIDTMQAFVSPDGFKYYAVQTTVLDSAQAAAMGVDSMCLVNYYIPSQNKYFTMAQGSDGGSSPGVMAYLQNRTAIVAQSRDEKDDERDGERRNGGKDHVADVLKQIYARS